MDQLNFRFIGPDGNRTIAVRGVPGDMLTMYVGMASGGLFKSEDAGGTWTSIFDDQDISSVFALALAPSDPDVVYVASLGHTFGLQEERGIFKTTDGGKTWW
jgi:photosystem II stability/assembly factor-like uncharacterized protein